jgi:hypothetical protein
MLTSQGWAKAVAVSSRKRSVMSRGWKAKGRTSNIEHRTPNSERRDSTGHASGLTGGDAGPVQEQENRNGQQDGGRHRKSDKKPDLLLMQRQTPLLPVNDVICHII